MTYRYWVDVPTRWNDNDCYGHMNNVIHYEMMDTVVNTWLIREAGFDPRKDDVIGMCVASRCEYKAEAAFPETLRVGMRIGKLGTSSVRYEVGLFRADGETLIASGDFTHVFTDRVTRRPVPIAGRMREAMERLAVS
ncbi:acyl-CoA thioesterase [Actinocorallia sp. API 0066]|uniref:acyl-CoA thioesterase n=1 Tax=Actinocorallia sp. API 0066 TaxID=2896846 RepID=UPI0035ABB29F